MADDRPFTLSAHARIVLEARAIETDWIARALASAVRSHPDGTDPSCTHALITVPEREGRVLRVVYNHTVSPPNIVTA